jgi:hypothetical protein
MIDYLLMSELGCQLDDLSHLEVKGDARADHTLGAVPTSHRISSHPDQC